MEEEKKIRKITLSSLSSTLTTQKCARQKRKGESNIHDAESHGLFQTAGSVLSHWYFFRFMCVMSRLRLPLRVKKKLLSQHSETLSDPVPHTLSQPWKPLPDSSSSTSSPAFIFASKFFK